MSTIGTCSSGRARPPNAARVCSCRLRPADRARQHALQHVIAADKVVIERCADMGQDENDQEPAHQAMDGEQWR